MKEKQDIFDRLMAQTELRFFQPLYKKYKEIILYLFFGGLTFIVSIGSYVFFELFIGMSPLVANLFSWILAVGFAYITNRIWVFTSIAHGIKEIIKEVIAFFMGRVATLFLEEVILFVGINILDFDSVGVKVVAQILVIITNYYVSKIVVFSNRK